MMTDDWWLMTIEGVTHYDLYWTESKKPIKGVGLIFIEGQFLDEPKNRFCWLHTLISRSIETN
jgi:hypothetical protein